MRGERLDAYWFHEREWESYDDLLAAFEWEVPERFNMAHYVCDRWADGEDGDRTALLSERETGERASYTFAELATLTDGLAGHLRAQGVGRGDRVGVNAPQTPETAIAHIACWKLGAVSVPLSTLFGTEGLRYRLDDADAVACVVHESNVETFRDVVGEFDFRSVLTVGVPEGELAGEERDFWTAVESADPVDEAVETDAEEDAIVIYTSGTTGDPKGVRHAHRVLLGNLPLFVTAFCDMEMHDDDVYWTPSEWAWVATLFDVLFPGLFYGKPVLAYDGGPFDPETAFDLVERHGVTNFFAPPTALRMMMQAGTSGYDLSSVRVVPSGGESLGESVVEWAAETFDGAAVHEGYGQTEANMIVGDCTALTESREGAIGPPAPGHEVAILDPESLERLPPGETGEIAVRYEGDPVCFVEYLGKPEATRNKVREGWLLTEDLGVMDEDDYVTFVGRADTVIISAGYRIGPVEIEEALATHEAVADAGVIGVPDDERGEVPKAFVVLSSGFEASEALAAALRDHVKDRLARYEYPREVEFVADLPKTTSGKVRRVELEEREGLR
ncbi:acyl-CoA synthetase [Halomarina litorea]|uniref:acyl-CoA synthetase n=1 Tax=Halomarina litorea TaxID=2961595 RepID=UPI0020C25228|nr:AMP-binding protein [Halomarina sp. BCD28]